MTPSNPFSFFVNGSETKKFTYAAGRNPYYIIVHGRSYIPLSVMVFANDPDDARGIILDMLDMAERCVNEYETATRDHRHAAEGVTSKRRQIATLHKALRGGDPEYEVSIGLVARNQLYKIGWASNDNW